jgi:hypothetical protein
MNEKKSQITLFVLLGIVLLMALIFFFVYISVFNSNELDQQTKRQYQADPTGAIRNMVETCMFTSLEKRLVQISENGGVLLPDVFRKYNGKDYTYWCLDEGEFGCVNRIISRTDMEISLNRVMQQDVLECADFSGLELAGFNIKFGNMTATVTIGPLRVDGTINWPVIMTKRGKELRQSDYLATVESDFGGVYELALKVLYAELAEGTFNKDEWMNEHSSAYYIHKHKPYPDVLYEISKYSDRTKNFVTFRFGINGKETIKEIETRFAPTPLSACRLPDRTVFAQTRRNTCISKGGLLLSIPPETWQSTSTPGLGSPTEQREDCGLYEDGESWCEYQGPVGLGLDYVGTRHYLRSCHNGEIYIESCRDYREEICVQTVNKPFEAACRPNRWHDCSAQTTSGACEDTTQRDCFWNNNLLGQAHVSYGKKYDNNLCHPQVPPGFRHWINGPVEENICSMANEQKFCDGFNCPQNWVDTSAIYCSSLGDCGNYRNVANVATYGGFATVAGNGVDAPRDYTLLENDIIDQSYRLTLNMDVPSLGAYTGEFENEYASLSKIAIGKAQFSATASGWDDCDMCKCIMGIPVPDCKFKKYIHGSNVCSIWERPSNGNCNGCGNSVLPCSEYWCKSLGNSCEFFETEDGVGTCRDAPPSGGGLRIVDINVTGNFSMARETIFFNGKTFTGYNISPKIEPFTVVTLNLKLNRPARCTLKTPSFESSFGFSFLTETIHYASMSASTTHNISLHARPVTELVEPLDVMDFSSIAEAVVSDRIDSRVEMFVQQHPGYVPQARGIIETWREQVDPTIRNSIEMLENEMQGRAVDIVSKMTTLSLECIDNAGDKITPTAIQYVLLEDTFGPVMLNYEGGYGGPNEFQIILNEPAECKYDNADVSWNLKNFTMDCPFMGYGLISMETTCYGYTDGFEDDYRGPIYITCRDQPGFWRNFSMRFNRTQNFTLKAAFQPRYLKMVAPNIIILNKTTSGLSQLPAFEVNTTEVDLKLRFKHPRNCRIDGYVPGLVHYPDFICGVLNGSYGCDGTLPSRIGLGLNASEITEYPIKCRAARDFNERSFTIEI